jgi:hypothetical protein
MRLPIVLLAFVTLALAWLWWSEPRLRDLGPRMVSNQTAQPLALVGEHFLEGMRVHLGAPFSRELVATVLDAHHAYVRLPADLQLPAANDSAEVTVAIGRSHAALTLVNDAAFVDLTDLSLAPDGTTAFAISPPTDTLYTIDLSRKSVRSETVGDGPSAVQSWRDAAGQSWLAVAHYYTASLWLMPIVGNTAKRRKCEAPRGAAGLTIIGDHAFVAGQVADEVWAIDLATCRTLWKQPVAPNPRALAGQGALLAVGSLQTGAVEVLRQSDGAIVSSIAPGPATPIIGGHTEKFAPFIMGGKAPRALVAAPSLGRIFMSSIGPNIGPNAAQMEVSMNGGVASLDASRARFERHLGLGAGVTEGLAYDDERQLLFAADIATGRVHIFDAAALALSDEAARHALLQSLPIPPPVDFPLLRSLADFAVPGRSGIELHSGPRALRLFGHTLYVLDRFSGTLAVVDVSEASHAMVREQIVIADSLAQAERRRGQILYHADLGRTGMSCDTCHIDGHTEGVLFTKTKPMRIYRSPTLRGVRDTPPYFVPPTRVSLVDTAQFVGDRNRFHNPDLTNAEVSALAHYNALITNVANPFVGADGAPSLAVTLPDGGQGNARAGLVLFEQHCASCHPAPLFATDQDTATRAQAFDVGTPKIFPLRPQLQDHYFKGFPPPSLLGAWDVFPMFNSGAAGLRAAADGRVEMTNRSALHEVLTTYANDKHGGLGGMSTSDRRDLFAYVLSL